MENIIFSPSTVPLILPPLFDDWVSLKVLLSDSGQALQRDLNQIAESADTSTYEGLSYALNGNPYLLVILNLMSFGPSLFSTKITYIVFISSYLACHAYMYAFTN